MRQLHYYKQEEVEELKNTFSSWIGKKAHVGYGRTATLNAIVIKPKRDLKLFKDSEKLFRIEFEFEDNLRFNAYEFLFYNGLIPLAVQQNNLKPGSGRAA